ncbi:MAG: hypothetical protein K0R49_1829 [Burkholderiales bacterium]|jgi:hypothetical protein|nr:hypothetical protein [Burkholderiales bacterium]
MKFSNKISLILGSICSTYSFAGPDWTIHLYNYSPSYAYIVPNTSTCWSIENGALYNYNPYIVHDHKYGLIRTEEINSGNCWTDNYKELTFKVNDHLVKLYSHYGTTSAGISFGNTTQRIYVDDEMIYEKINSDTYNRYKGQTTVNLIHNGYDHTIKVW